MSKKEVVNVEEVEVLEGADALQDGKVKLIYKSVLDQMYKDVADRVYEWGILDGDSPFHSEEFEDLFGAVRDRLLEENDHFEQMFSAVSCWEDKLREEFREGVGYLFEDVDERCSGMISDMEAALNSCR